MSYLYPMLFNAMMTIIAFNGGFNGIYEADDVIFGSIFALITIISMFSGLIESKGKVNEK